MALKTLTYTIEGDIDLVTSNGAQANPRGELALAAAPYKKKKGNNRTENDDNIIHALNWLGALYLTHQVKAAIDEDEGVVHISNIGKDKALPGIPGDALFKCFYLGAKKSAKGPVFLPGCLFEDGVVFPIRHKGSKDLNELFVQTKPDAFADYRLVGMSGGAKILRCRPRFKYWQLTFDINYRPEVIDEKTITKAIENAGALIGLCEWRPRWGLFHIATEKEIKDF